MMQTINDEDASTWYKSLDAVYHIAGPYKQYHQAIYSHEPLRPEEIQLKVGDILQVTDNYSRYGKELGIIGNHWNGFSEGLNKRTNKSGMYPSFKAKQKIIVEDFPGEPR